MAHWHSHNPWVSTLVYIPDLEELAEVIHGHHTQEETLAYWQRAGHLIDAYLLLQPTGAVLVGIRYGPDPAEYLSIYHTNDAGLWRLVAKYQPDHPLLEARR